MAAKNITNDKTETRRLVKGKNLKAIEFQGLNEDLEVNYASRYGTYAYEEEPDDRLGPEWVLDDDDFVYPIGQCPYGKVGDWLWQKETFAWYDTGFITNPIYKADYHSGKIFNIKWTSSMLMPFEAARHFQKIESITIERLNTITEESAIAEGINQFEVDHLKNPDNNKFVAYQNYDTSSILDKTASPIISYQTLWESINGKGSWDINPFVWVVKYKNYSLQEFEAELNFNWLEHVAKYRNNNKN